MRSNKKKNSKRSISIFRAFIPAAGAGSRMFELTQFMPKELLPIGTEPLLLRLIRQIKTAGIKEIVIALSPKKQIIRTYLGDGRKYGVRIHYVYAPTTGIDKALWAAKAHLTGQPFLFCVGDVCVKEKALFSSLRTLYKKHQMPILALGKQDSTIYASPTLKRYGPGLWEILRFENKQRARTPGFSSLGIMVLSPDFFTFFARPTKRERPLSVDLDHYAKERTVLALVTNVPTWDCGTIARWTEAYIST